VTSETRLELLRELRNIQAEYPFVRVLTNFLLEGQFSAQARVNEIQNALLADPPPPVEGASVGEPETGAAVGSAAADPNAPPSGA